MSVISSLRRFYNAFLFNEATPLIKEAFHKHLQASHIPPLGPSLQAASAKLSSLRISTESTSRFFFSVFWHFRLEMLALLAMGLVRSALSLSVPNAVKSVITAVRTAAETRQISESAVWAAVLLAAITPVIGILMQHYFYAALKLHQKIAIALSQLLYKHTLGIRVAHKRDVQTGDLVNHMSTDIEVLSDAPLSVTESLMYLIILVGGFVVLFSLVGSAAISGLVVFAVLIPLAKVFAKRYTKYDTKLMESFDKRVTFFSQVVSGIRVIKYFGWTSGIEKQIAKIREEELGARRSYAFTSALGNLIFMSANVFSGIAIFATFHAQGKQLTAEIVFSSIATFGILAEPMRYLSHYLSDFINMRVSTGRLRKFFAEESQEIPATATSPEHKAIGISLRHLSMRYPHASEAAIKNVTLSIAPGESLAIVGAVGCGKSTLLSAILGEIPIAEGCVEFTHLSPSASPRLAFVPQEPFTLNASLSENICFGQSSQGIEDAIKYASLTEDIAALPHKLETEIGEHGVNLSGGQKQRVALARAIMRKPGLVLLDDPFSALDSKTESEISENLLFGEWKNITRIVCTHRLNHIHRFDKILLLEEGAITDFGTFEELQSRSVRFQNFLKHLQQETPSPNPAATTPECVPSTLNPFSVRITEDEDRVYGRVKASVYLEFLKAFGGPNTSLRPWIIAAIFIAIAASVVSPLAQNSWMANWTESLTPSSGQQNSQIGILVYGVLGLTVLLSAFGKELFTLLRGVEAGRLIHERALHGVLGAPLRFFDATPTGRILNRFSRDQFAIESQLSWIALDFITCVSQLLVAFSLIIVLIPQLSIALIPVLAIYYWAQHAYRPAARDTKRLDSICRSPRFAHYKETLHGLAVIRSFEQQDKFLHMFQEKVETSVRMFLGLVLVNRWFSVRVPILSALVTLSTALGVLFLAQKSLLNPGMAGLILTYTLDFSSLLNWSVRAFSELESRLTAVERLSHYSSLTPEPVTTKEPALSDNTPWPTAGRIEFRHVTARYASQLPLVLKGISFIVPACKRAGISGRTGSGKSTILQVLFRTIPAENGSITIDGVDTATIPLERLRRAISIIPQFPTLFIGTLRQNLDYFETASDADVWQALERVQLAQLVRSLPQGLLTPVAENGSNFSVGQKQLLCLARAFLNKSKIIVMDEATASIDVETDNQIQTAIREQCQNLTIVIIAHRMSTISDCDLHIRLSEGKIESSSNT